MSDERIANLERAVSYLSERVLGEAFSVPDLAARSDTAAEDRLQELIARVAALEASAKPVPATSSQFQAELRRVRDEITARFAAVERQVQVAVQKVDDLTHDVGTVAGAFRYDGDGRVVVSETIRRAG